MHIVFNHIDIVLSLAESYIVEEEDLADPDTEYDPGVEEDLAVPDVGHIVPPGHVHDPVVGPPAYAQDPGEGHPGPFQPRCLWLLLG